MKVFIPCWSVWRTRDKKSINQLKRSYHYKVCEELRQQINQSNNWKYSYHAEVCEELETANQSNKWKYSYHAEVCEELEMPGRLWRGWEDESRQNDNIWSDI